MGSDGVGGDGKSTATHTHIHSSESSKEFHMVKFVVCRMDPETAWDCVTWAGCGCLSLSLSLCL